MLEPQPGRRAAPGEPMRFDARTRSMEVKLLLHGPPGAGRRTNLVHLRDTLPQPPMGPSLRARLTHMDLDLGTVVGRRVRARCVCLPEDESLERLRRAVLQGIDGVVFVADSERERGLDNVAALAELSDALERARRPLPSLPRVFQWNKRDVRSPLPVRVLQRDLNPGGADAIPAIASSGIGVWRTWRRVVERVLEEAARRAEETIGGIRA